MTSASRLRLYRPPLAIYRPPEEAAPVATTIPLRALEGVRDARLIQRLTKFPDWQLPDGTERQVAAYLLDIVTRKKEGPQDAARPEFEHSARDRMRALKLLVELRDRNLQAEVLRAAAEAGQTPDVHLHLHAATGDGALQAVAGMTEEERGALRAAEEAVRSARLRAARERAAKLQAEAR